MSRNTVEIIARKSTQPEKDAVFGLDQTRVDNSERDTNLVKGFIGTLYGALCAQMPTGVYLATGAQDELGLCAVIASNVVLPLIGAIGGYKSEGVGLPRRQR